MNFPSFAATVRNDPAVSGDSFFHKIGETTFDVGEVEPNNESNLLNLVADAERAAQNQLVPAFAGNPIRVFIQANGVVRDGIYAGMTGDISLSDIFRVLPLGVSPVELTPTYPVIDFYLFPEELRLASRSGWDRAWPPTRSGSASRGRGSSMTCHSQRLTLRTRPAQEGSPRSR